MNAFCTMRRILLPLLITASCIVQGAENSDTHYISRAAAEGPYAIQHWKQTKDGKIGFFVTREQLKKTPEWTFDGRSGLPLDGVAACKRAQEALRAKNPKLNELRLRGYVFASADEPSAPNRYYYICDFDTVPIDPALRAELRALVLMDGTIVLWEAQK